MSTAVRRALYGSLAGDTTLNAALGSPAAGFAKAIYYQQAPPAAAFPFVVFSRSSGTPTDTLATPGAIENDVWLVKAVDRASSADVAESIAARVSALLNDASLSISGRTLIWLRRESDIDYLELVDGVRYVHVGSLFRLTTS